MEEKISVIIEVLNSEPIVILNSGGYFPNTNRFIIKLSICKAAYQGSNQFRGKKKLLQAWILASFCVWMFAYTHILCICVQICQEDCYSYPNYVPFANHFNAVSILGISWKYRLVIWTSSLLFSCCGHILYCTGLIYRLNISREEFSSQLCTSLAQCNAIPTIFFLCFSQKLILFGEWARLRKIFCWYCLWGNKEYTFENTPLILTSGKKWVHSLPYPQRLARARNR